MADDTKPTIRPGKPKKTWYKKWRPKDFALYLMSIDMKYVLPGTTNEQIMAEVPNLHCGIGKVSWLRNHREFQKTVEEYFIDRILSRFSTETMFCWYLRHSIERNMDSEKPSEKLIDVLGHLSGLYTPRTSKPKKKDKMTPEQIAKMIHQREQINAQLNGKTDIDGFDITREGKEDVDK